MVVTGTDTSEYWVDDRGDFCGSYETCDLHEWRDSLYKCPWPECKSSARWPLMICYRISSYKPRTGTDDEKNADIEYGDLHEDAILRFGKMTTLIAEFSKPSDRWQWVEYVRADS